MSDLYSLMNEGNRFIEREEWERAFDVLRRAEQLDADNLEVVHGLATVTFHLGRFAQSSRYYRRLLELSPSSSELLVGLASCSHHLGRHELAVDLCQRAVLLDPQEYDGYSYGAGSALALGQYELAEELAARGLRWFADDLELHSHRGIAAFHNGDDDVARIEFECALEIDSSRADAAAYLLRLADGRGEAPAGQISVEELEVHFARGCACGEDSALLHLWMGEAYRRRGLLLRATECLKQAARIDDELPGPAAGLARIAIARGAPRRAIQHWNRELDIDPTRPEVLAGLAEAQETLGERRAAAGCLLEAIELAGPGHPGCEEWRARVEALQRHLERSGRGASASTDWEPPSPSPCRYCGRRLAQVLPRGSLCRACLLGTRAGALLMLSYLVNLIVVTSGGIVVLAGALLSASGDVVLPAGWRGLLAVSGLSSVAAVLAAAFIQAEVVWRARAHGQLSGGRAQERGQMAMSLSSSLAFIASEWRARVWPRRTRPEDPTHADGVAIPPRLGASIPFPGALAVLPLAALLLFLEPRPSTALGVVALCAFLFTWGLVAVTARWERSGPRALLRSFLGDLLSGEGRARAAESLTTRAPADAWDAFADTESHLDQSAPATSRRGRMVRVSVAAALLATLLLLGGWAPGAGHVLEASWPAAWSFLGMVPYLALLLLGMILTLAVDDLEAGMATLGHVESSEG